MIATILLCTLTNLVVNGDFENVLATPKALDKTILRQQRLGWEYGRGPIAFRPAGWRTASGLGRCWSVDCREDARQRPFVHGGEASLFLGDKEQKTAHLMQERTIPPGRYALSLWTRGTGRLRVLAYACDDRGKWVKCPPPAFEGSSADKIEIAPSETWTETRGRVRLGDAPGVSGVYFALMALGGDVHVDDVVLTEER